MTESAYAAVSATLLVQACIALVVTLLIVSGVKSMSRGWDDGVPRLAPRSIAYAEVICGIMMVLNALAVYVFIVVHEGAIALFAAGTSLTWHTGLMIAESTVEIARKRDDESQRQARERRFTPPTRS
jgi:hypothetical protein